MAFLEWLHPHAIALEDDGLHPGLCRHRPMVDR
jgi:hypothetical protein